MTIIEAAKHPQCPSCWAFLPKPHRYDYELFEECWESGTPGEDGYDVRCADVEREVAYRKCSRCGDETKEVPAC